MRKFIAAFKKYFGFGHGQEVLHAEELQTMFSQRYRAFRELLTANNNALEAMAELETALIDGRSFSMVFVRSKSTVVTVNVFKMVQNLRIMCDDRYPNLEKAFNRIQHEVDLIIDKRLPDVEGEWIIPVNRVNRTVVELTGEKMANLGEAGSLPGIHIPPGFSVTASASRHFYLENRLYPEINRIFQQTDAKDMEDLLQKSEKIQQLILDAPLPAALKHQLFANFDQLQAATEKELTVAMRSSALGEDLGNASFAGLYHSELKVARQDLTQAYKKVLASKYSARAMTYRLTKGYRHEDIIMCVGCLVMIKAELSGVCYSHAIGGIDTLDIFFAQGSGKHIVDGTGKTSRYSLSREVPYAVMRSKIQAADEMNPLSARHAAELAAIAMQLENHFGAPQDIEWSIDEEGKLYILQSRPISTREVGESPDDAHLFDDERLLLRGGACGCPGAACGEVFIVRNKEDMVNFPHRAILVVEHPLPEWVPLLKKAAAMVAETGSEAGHLATISREYGLPSLLSVDNAIKELQHGQFITVDASNRAIYSGCIEELLVEPTAKFNPMDGSPVQLILKEVLKRLTPLNLTDPASPFFRSARCKTMHDLTRFCHEKSVVEMFGFGLRYKFDQGAAKRLVSRDKVPLDWWVINLADGFSDSYDTTSSFIRIEQIASDPMLALWDGMHVFPWAGPPAVEASGMGAIFFRSTMQAKLNPAVGSTLTAKNYFLVARNYCNLSVRLGYHFAMVEAFISTMRTERYLTFRFKGGAADERRRRGRIELIAEILRRYDFRIDLTGDALTARMEKKRQQFLYDRLRVLGYLIIHTRQIDMVMTDPQQYAHYRNKFIREIEEMLVHEE